jgi:hypothetical protein
MERYAPFYPEPRLLTDYLGGDGRIFWIRPQQIVETLRRLDREVRQLFADSVRAGEPVPAPEQICASHQDLITLAELVPTLYLSDINWTGKTAPLEALLAPVSEAEAAVRTGPAKSAGPPPGLPPELQEDFGTWEETAAAPPPTPLVQVAPTAPVAPRVESRDFDESLPPRVRRVEVHATSPYAGNINELRRDLQKRIRSGQRVHIFCDNEGQAERLREILDEIADDLDFPVGELQSGFVLPTLGLGVVVLTDREIFHRYRKRQAPEVPRQPGDLGVRRSAADRRLRGARQLRHRPLSGHQEHPGRSQPDGLSRAVVRRRRQDLRHRRSDQHGREVRWQGRRPSGVTKLGGTSGRAPRRRRKPRSRIWRKSSLELAAIRSSRKGTPTAAIRICSKSSKPPSSTTRRPTEGPRSPTSSATWNARRRWTG